MRDERKEPPTLLEKKVTGKQRNQGGRKRFNENVRRKQKDNWKEALTELVEAIHKRSSFWRLFC